ncbi:porin [Variovorax sp. HJSM1_2]|uniref:porin n=1 Tax=Variovorax sp. HJSM1_2 TaxID=3366263 RepID=UPI003BCB7647
MKKSLIALAVLAASGAAMAQSTVTLYGVVDANVNATKNTVVAANATNTALVTAGRPTQTGVGTGGQNGSRWGIRVKEDLGGGLAAVATIEAGLNADTGTSAQGGLAYGRQVFVGLSNSLGTVSLGRQYSVYDDLHGLTSVQGNNDYDVSLGGIYNASNNATNQGLLQTARLDTPAGIAARVTLANATLSGVGAWVGYANSRVDNSIKLQSASFGGFSASATYGFGENKNTTANSGDATYDVSAGLKYANGPVVVALAYQETEFANATAGANKLKLQNTLLGGSFDAGFAKFFANYNQAKFSGLDAADEYSLGASVPFGALTLVGQYAYSKSDDLGKNQGFGVEAWYDLSKRTRAYTSYAQTKKELLNDDSNSKFAVGIRHAF